VPGAHVTNNRKKLKLAIRQSLRELRIHLAVLNHQVSGRLELKDIDLDCLDLIAQHAPLSPSEIARRLGLHPATMTGILDRLEAGGWAARVRDSSDRRAVMVEPFRQRTAEVMRLYSGMNSSIDQICDSYRDAELELLADFLRRTAAAGRAAGAELSHD
jgi:DNA-binding MarR family transcriptional regulator